MEKFFINTTGQKPRCGVHQMGLDVYETIKPLGFVYTDDLASLPSNSIYVFNWHPGTNLSVLNASYLKELGGKSIGFLHDPYNNPDFFDIKCRLDPDFVDSHPFYSLPRIIKRYHFKHVKRDKIIVGSWGFGLGHKNFESIINLVESQLENCIIRLHIPYSDWCDPNGEGANRIAARCKELAKRNAIEISHEYLKKYDFLKWANYNTINMFSCTPMVAGISSCVDTALMADRPIGVNNCMLYKAIYSDKTAIETNSIVDLIKNGPLLQKYRDAWTEEKFREKIKCLIEKILV
jgi:hypothetical protein